MIINVLYKFKIYENIVCDDNKTLWWLENKEGKRYRPMKKLSYNKERKSYYINLIPVTRKRLYNLMYRCEYVIDLSVKKPTPF